jgi:hypothetical protein
MKGIPGTLLYAIVVIREKAIYLKSQANQKNLILK